MKTEAEDVVKKSGLQYTILRATQFHELIDRFFSQYFILPVALLPGKLKIQPVETRVVAERLYELSALTPVNCTYNLGGREILESGRRAQDWLRARRRHQWIIGIPGFGKALNAVERGRLTCSEAAKDSISWTQWLERKYEN